MQRTENVTSPKQVYRGPCYQKLTGENHHYTHNPGKSARHWACGRQTGSKGPTVSSNVEIDFYPKTAQVQRLYRPGLKSPVGPPFDATPGRQFSTYASTEQ
jgi:hypothetical protein